MQNSAVNRRFMWGRAGHFGLGSLLIACGAIAVLTGGCPSAELPEGAAPDEVVAAATSEQSDAVAATMQARDAVGATDVQAADGDRDALIEVPTELLYSPGKNLYYTVTPNDGPRDLTVSASVHTVNGQALPKGTCIWYFDNTVVTGPMRTHATIQHTFTTGGLHTVRLIVTVAGFVQAVGCAPPSGANVTVRPIVTGRIADSTDRPVAGVVVTAAGVQTPATTNSAGQYVLTVPYGWSGAVAPSNTAYLFNPLNRTFNAVHEDTGGANFVATPVGNHAPQAQGQSVQTSEDVPVNIQLTGTDQDGNALTYAIVTLPTQGTLKDGANNHPITAGELPYALVSGGRTVSYAPTANYSGADAFTFRVNDGQTNSTPATVSVTVQSVNDLPTADAQSVTANQGVAKSITLSGSDLEGSSLTYKIVTLPAHGTLKDSLNNHVIAAGELPYTLVTNGRTVSYTPTASYSGADAFTFRVNDGQTDSAPATVSITVLTVNAPPAASAQAVTVNEDVAKSITLVGTDPDANPLTYIVLTLPMIGTLRDNTNNHVILSGELPYTLVSAGRTLTYTNGLYHIGADNFTFRVNDGQLDSAAANVSLTVLYGNHPPTANTQQVADSIGTPKAIALSASDPHNDSLTFAVATAPAHGTLTGTPPSVTYTPAAGYTGADSFTFTASDYGATSAAATVSITIASGAAWTPPIGIPAPSFGINESHTMFAGQQWNYGSGPEPYRNAGNGPYTHYIDNTSAASTDTSNTYGSPSKPRKTIPTDLPPGSVVEVHGGPYNFTSGGRTVLGGSGTAAKPIFIRGISASSKPVFSAETEVLGSYVIVEYLDFNGPDGMYVIRPNHHIAIRHCEKRGGVGTYRSAMSVAGDPGVFVHDVVFYDNKVHDNGDWQGAGDQDYHGFHVSEAAYNVWFVDNEMYHNSGDGLQINAGTAQATFSTHHIYVGRNVSHNNKQGGAWCKQAADVIVSQNTFYGHRPSDSSCGGGTGYQLGPERIWFLYNHIYDCEIGIGIGSASGPGGDGPGTDSYFVGNVIHHITQTVSSPTGPWKWGCAFQVTDEVTRKHIVNNTIYDCDAGIMYPRGIGAMYLVDNAFGNVRQEHVWVDRDDTAALSTLHHSIFGGGARIVWGATPVYNLASFRAVFPAQGAGCSEADPKFVNPAAGDFHLQATSPAINSGATDDVYTTFYTLYGLNISVDFDGIARPRGGTMDMGAFER